MRRTVRLYRRLLGAHLRAALQYEADFWIMIGAAALTQVIGVVFLGAIFAKIPELHGWAFWEVVTVYAMVSIGEGVGSLFFEGTWRLARRINLGELDYLLVRPYPVALQVMGSDVGLHGAGNLVVGGVLLGLGVANSRIEWSLGTVALGVLLLISAIVIKTAISLGTNSGSFWIAGPVSVFGYALHQVGDLARYPITIYALGVRLFIGVVVPFAFVSFFPVAVLLDRGDQAKLGLLTPIVAVYCVVAAWWVFRRGLRRYESAGN
ncbi:ABC transporter permease [Luedemannella helvata]|uniref:ABC-2 family transporter protein n=1 Tax=Luedemannella helvata TaxID=349315 RepID=A0ABP4WI90_9ACTN